MGYLNIFQMIVIIVFNNWSGLYYGNVFLAFPIIDLIVFFKMMRKDSVKLRRKFYLWQFFSYIAEDLF